MRKVLYILGQLDDRDIEWLVRVGRKRALADGEVLVRQGVHSPSLYILIEGQATVAIAGLGSVVTLKPGEMIGELSFVDSTPPSATVTAAGRCTVLEVPKSELKEKIDAEVGFGFRFYKAMALFLADRLRATQDQQKQKTEVDLEATAAQEDELDDSLLGAVSLAGGRFERLLRMLAGAQTV